MSGLRDVLAEHHWAAEVGSPEGVDPYLWCVCGWRSDDATDAHWRSGEHARLAHAHVEAAVLDWLRARLASDEVRESVAEVLSCGATGEMTAYSEMAHPDHNRWSWRGDGHAPAIREQYRADAEAALTAVLAALEVER